LAKASEVSAYLVATYGVFAAISPSVFGFGVTIATEREQGFLALKSVLPVPAAVYPLAKLFMAFAVTAIVVLVIYCVSIFGAGVHLSVQVWMGMFAVHLAGVIPFALIGIAIGYSFSSQGAIAIGNLVFFMLSILGGLWFPIHTLPPFMQAMGWAMPSFHLSQLALMVQGMAPARNMWLHIGALMAMTVALVVLVRVIIARKPV
jgi:ABC-2 type transport system permease protein